MTRPGRTPSAPLRHRTVPVTLPRLNVPLSPDRVRAAQRSTRRMAKVFRQILPALMQGGWPQHLILTALVVFAHLKIVHVLVPGGKTVFTVLLELAVVVITLHFLRAERADRARDAHSEF